MNNNESKTRKYQLSTSKLVYLEARRLAEKHNVWWNKIQVTEIGDPVDGTVLIEFKGLTEKHNLVERDIEYVHALDEKITKIFNAGKLNV